MKRKHKGSVDWPRQTPPAHDEEEEDNDNAPPRPLLGREVRMVDIGRVYTTLGARGLSKLWPCREWQSRGSRNAEPGWGDTFTVQAGLVGVVVHEWDGARPDDPTSAPWPGATTAAKGRQHPVLLRITIDTTDFFVPIDSGGGRVLRRGAMPVPVAEEVAHERAGDTGTADFIAVPTAVAAAASGGGGSCSSSSEDDEAGEMDGDGEA